MTAREDQEALVGNSNPIPAQSPTTPAPTCFSFERSFAIIRHSNGGYVIQQIHPENKVFSRAFTHLHDLTNFLLAEKRNYEQEYDC